MELVKGQVVYSRLGRDNTKAYIIAGLEEERVLLVDGRKRPLAAPKRKNVRHITPTRTVVAQGEMDTDLNVRAALSAFEKNAETDTQGGERLV